MICVAMSRENVVDVAMAFSPSKGIISAFSNPCVHVTPHFIDLHTNLMSVKRSKVSAFVPEVAFRDLLG